MPLLDHIHELRRRLVFSLIYFALACILVFSLYKYLVPMVNYPFRDVESEVGQQQFFVHGLLEGFFLRFKLSLFGAVLLSLPMFAYHGIRFIFPGLKKKEKLFVFYGLLASTVLIFLSASLTYYLILPAAVQFLLSSDFVPEGVGQMLNYGTTLAWAFQFFLVSLILFQVPILLEILLALNLLSRKMLFKSGRYVILIIFILSAILTPPDPITQVGIALPLVGLFYLTILIAKIFKFGEN